MSTELKYMGGGSLGSCGELERSGKSEEQLLEPESPVSELLLPTAEDVEEMEKKYAAFVRNDAFGMMGRGELPAAEKVLLGIAMVTLVPIRVVMGICILVVYYVICRFCTVFSAPNRDEEQEDYAHMTGWRRKVVVQCGKFLSRAMLFNFGFYWIKKTRLYSAEEAHTDHFDEFKRGGVIVSNHVSYLDILYHMSSSFPSFVAKRSVAKLSLVGIISKCLGCVFVQRESKASDFKGVSGVVTARIQEAHQNNNAPMMLLFPEGTTTNGDYLLPFKTGAFLAKVPVLPVVLRYPYKRFSPAWDSISGVCFVLGFPFLMCHLFATINLKLFSPLLIERFCIIYLLVTIYSIVDNLLVNTEIILLVSALLFFGSCTACTFQFGSFFLLAGSEVSGRHVFLLLCQFINYIEVIHLPVYYPSEQEKQDPKLYACNVRKLMASEGNLILSDIGLAEKRIYHAALNGNSLPRVLRPKDD